MEVDAEFEIYKEILNRKFKERFPITEKALLAALLDPSFQHFAPIVNHLEKLGTTKFNLLLKYCERYHINTEHLVEVIYCLSS